MTVDSNRLLLLLEQVGLAPRFVPGLVVAPPSKWTDDRTVNVGQKRIVTEVERCVRWMIACIAACLTLASTATPAQSVSYVVPTLDLITLSSEWVGLVQVASWHDSIFAPAGRAGERTIGIRPIRWLIGSEPFPRSVAIRIGDGWPHPRLGDTLLVLWEASITPGRGTPDTSLSTHVFYLGHRVPIRQRPAFTRDFRVVRDPDSILAIVVHRAEMVRSGHPLGDERRLTWTDFALGRGALSQRMPEESEAQLETYPHSGSLNQLAYPADADLLPSLLEATHSPVADVRAWAAEQLAEYPPERVVPRLRELLQDRGTSLIRHLREHGAEDSVWVPVVRDAAIRALGMLKADTTAAP